MTYEAKPQPETLNTALEKHGIVITAKFVPFSQSRNKDQKDPSLNWRITVRRAADLPSKVILETDYMAGIAHAPSYGTKPPANWQDTVKHWQRNAPVFEAENGFRATYTGSYGGMHADRKQPIQPKPADVMHCLLSDAGAIDARDFEDWASEYGYDADSRTAETIYRACLDIALRLRNSLGEAAFNELRDAAQDY